MRKKADDLLARLNRGEDFATLARTESEGPSRVRAEGGLMQTSPGSYAVESVNAALASLPLNRVSPILEGPTSLHIVRVEARREAGPATFEDSRTRSARRILTEKIVKAADHLPRQAPPRHPHLHHLRRHRERPDRAGGPVTGPASRRRPSSTPVGEAPQHEEPP